jgi:hypothetical protein
MTIFFKKIILFSLCALLLLPAVARAEVTCCACEHEETAECAAESGGSCPSTWLFTGFACASGDRTCNYTCTSGEANTPRSGTWRPKETGSDFFKQGDLVTCCYCSDGTPVCRASNQTCGTICGTRNFVTGGIWYRRDTASFGGTGGTESGSAGSNESIVSSVSEGFTPPEPQAPNISLPIPGFVGFSEVKVEGGSISIPWIAEYVNAIYNFVLAIAAGFASFIFIVAGFKYVLAHGDKGKITKAKSMMINSLVGLFMTFGAYLILYTINPELTSFKNIRLGVIGRNELSFETTMQTTEANTQEPASAESASSSASEPAAGSHTSTFENCPISLSATNAFDRPDRDPRTVEFAQGISPALHGATARERVIEVADAAVKCGVHFGACGRTTGTINALAGIGSSSCLETSSGCWQTGSSNRSISNTQRQSLTAKETVSVVYARFRSEIASWPDLWANELQPGDTFIVYNANSSQFGTHAMIFTGWNGDRAQVVQGAYNRLVNESTICIKSTCANPKPLIKTFRAQ